MITATIKIHFSLDPDLDTDEIEANGVPKTMIMEKMSTIVKGLSEYEVADARNVVGNADMEKYLDARIAVDRKKLERMLKQQRDAGEGDE